MRAGARRMARVSAQEIPPWSGLSCTTRTTCRVCGSAALEPTFSLGEQYVSNFVRPEAMSQALRAPLELVLCRGCSLLQLRHTAPQELLYAGHYWYRSGVTATMRAALRDITATIERDYPVRAGDIALDIGSNDGTLLRSYTTPGLITAGVEPAKNLIEQGRQGVSHLIAGFWSHAAYAARFASKARIITAIGMFYDLEDPNQFIGDVAQALDPEGVFVAQLMSLRPMLEQNDVGNICHEHLEFYSLASLEALFGRHGLEVFDLTLNDVNGGSYRVFARHRGARPSPPPGAEARLEAVRRAERALGDPAVYVDFFRRAEANKARVRAFVEAEVAAGKRIWVYGASTKGNVLLQYYGLDHTRIEGAADRSPEKWGTCTVGTRIPIMSEAEARARRPDYFLVLPYAFLAEFLEREREFRARGGRFIVPLPELRIVA